MRILIAAMVCMVSFFSIAESSLEEIAKDGIGKSNGIFTNSPEVLGPKYIPGYEADVDKKAGHEFIYVDDTSLKDKANRKMLTASNEKNKVTGEGIILDTMSRNHLTNYENLTLFKRAEEVYANPIEMMAKLTAADCVESNKQSNQYARRIYKKKEKQIEDEKRSCERVANNIVCEKTLVLGCEEKVECDGNRISLKSFAGDLLWSYRYPYFHLGLKDDNYWKGICEVYERKVEFNISNKDTIDEVKLIYIAFDDYVWVKVNDHTVYVGPDGGDKIEVVDVQVTDGKVTDGKVTNGKNKQPCERSINQKKNVDIDLKPYLRDGENSIWVRVIVSGGGEFSMDIKTKQHCCTKIVDNWERRCWAEY
jgi:hypothetical protein